MCYKLKIICIVQWKFIANVNVSYKKFSVEVWYSNGLFVTVKSFREKRYPIDCVIESEMILLVDKHRRTAILLTGNTNIRIVAEEFTKHLMLNHSCFETPNKYYYRSIEKCETG